MPIALTESQIKEYDPPPNPAKLQDPRASKFVSKHGRTSWEVDALRPEVLNTILEEEILYEMDKEKYDFIVSQEETDRLKLKALKLHL